MNMILPVVCIALILPLLFAGVGKLFGDFCGVKHESVTLLGACLGGMVLFQGGTLVSLVSGVWNVLHGSTPSEFLLYCGGLISICVMSFCVVSIAVLLIEVPSRWLLVQGGHGNAIPIEFVRTLAVVLCLSASLGWICNAITESL